MAGDWKVDAGRLWAVGVTTSIVAGLAADAVLLVARAFTRKGIQVVLPGGRTDLTYLHTFLVAFVAGILAAAVLHLLLVAVPRGTLFFGWISVLVLVLSLAPVAAIDVSMASKAWLALMNVVTFAVIVSLLLGTLDRFAAPRAA